MRDLVDLLDKVSSIFRSCLIGLHDYDFASTISQFVCLVVCICEQTILCFRLSKICKLNYLVEFNSIIWFLLRMLNISVLWLTLMAVPWDLNNLVFKS